MNKLVKNVNTLTVQAGTNGACYCTYPCGSQTGYTSASYHGIQRDAASRGISPYNYSENE